MASDDHVLMAFVSKRRGVVDVVSTERQGDGVFKTYEFVCSWIPFVEGNFSEGGRYDGYFCSRGRYGDSVRKWNE